MLFVSLVYILARRLPVQPLWQDLSLPRVVGRIRAYLEKSLETFPKTAVATHQICAPDILGEIPEATSIDEKMERCPAIFSPWIHDLLPESSIDEKMERWPANFNPWMNNWLLE
jgi:hypothetical protein